MPYRAVLATACLLLAASLAACAPEDSGSAPADRAEHAAAGGADVEAVRAKLSKLLPEVKSEDVIATGVPGLYQVRQGGDFGYVTEDGRFLIQGDLVNLETGEEITEGVRKTERVEKLSELGEDNMILFAPEKAQDVKYKVTVFTDVDCGYCRKLHSQIADYNKEGIEIRYVFYPRSGPDTSSFRKAEGVWCSPDRKVALTVAKLGGPVTSDAACPNPIMREWKLGEELGLHGTPMLVLPNGEVVNGYVPPAQLAQRLASLETAAANPHAALPAQADEVRVQ
jgi:thiol:disulfide interchange protein DsbC